MTDSRTFAISATIRLADGSTIEHSEAHQTGIRCPETGGTIVLYSEDFAFARAEAVAAELGGEVLDVETFYYDPTRADPDDLDLY